VLLLSDLVILRSAEGTLVAVGAGGAGDVGDGVWSVVAVGEGVNILVAVGTSVLAVVGDGTLVLKISVGVTLGEGSVVGVCVPGVR